MIVAIPRFLGPVPLDVVLAEDHSSLLAITENPIEFGADVADHAIVQPKRLRLHAAIGATPRIGTIVHGFPSTRVQAAYDALIALQESKEPFSIVSGLRIYDDMLIEHISVHRDVYNAAILEFSASLKEVIIVAGAYAEGQPTNRRDGPAKSRPNAAGPSPEPGPTEQRSAPNVQRGPQTPAPQTVNPASLEGARNQTILRSMLPD